MARLRWLAFVSVGAFVASNVLAERFARVELPAATTLSAAPRADMRPGRTPAQVTAAAPASQYRSRR